MLQLDRHDPRPVYEQVVDGLEQLIARGILAEDAQLPSVRQLAMELSINPNTVQKAYADLLNRGIIYSVKGRGNFVSGGSGIRETLLRNIRDEMLALLRQAKSLGATGDELEELMHSISEVIHE